MWAFGEVRLFFDPMTDLNTACHVRVGRYVVLKPYGGVAGDMIKVATAGFALAYVDRADDFRGTYHIYSVDLSSGRFAHGVGFFPSPGDVTDLVVKPNGSIAWIQVDLNNNGPVLVNVRLADTHGVRVPRNGRQIAEQSLRLRGSKLTWKKGHRKFSAHLY